MASLTDLSFAAPELFVLTMTCVVLIVDLFLTERNRWISYYLALLTLVGAAFITVRFAVDQRVLAFEGMFVADRLSDILKLAIYLVIGVVFVYSKEYLQRRVLFKGEYFVLSLTGMLGMMVMVSAHSFLSMYLGLELMSLSLYAMVAFDRDSGIASEAAMKYFVLGGIASGTLLFGISILYGVTGSLDFSEIATALSSGHDLDLAVLFALSFVIVAVAFKLGAVPFHMWLPDVYDGAPTSVTLYLGTAPKIAGFALVVRVLVEALGQYQSDWANMLTILAVLSMAVGNLAAIAQSNIKRMLAYSTISHVGFILLGFISGTEEGLVAALFYTLVYALMAAGAFGVIILLSRAGFEADQLEDFKGLNERSPWFAGVMLILMFSMAGVPPLVGFHAKWLVLSAVVDVGLVWLAIAGVVFSVIGAFYYLRVIKFMYFDKPVDTRELQAGADLRFVLSANAVLVLLLGLFPGALIAWCAQAM